MNEIKNYIIVLVVACAIFGIGWFIGNRYSAGDKSLAERLQAISRDFDTASRAQRDAEARASDLSNQLDRSRLAISNLQGELNGLRCAGLRIATAQSNILEGLGRSGESLTTAQSSLASLQTDFTAYRKKAGK
jgi:chromosome segregation ATPase